MLEKLAETRLLTFFPVTDQFSWMLEISTKMYCTCHIRRLLVISMIFQDHKTAFCKRFQANSGSKPLLNRLRKVLSQQQVFGSKSKYYNSMLFYTVFKSVTAYAICLPFEDFMEISIS